MSHAHMHHGAEKVVKGALPEASSDMNVTPLIDVLLVLLDHLHGGAAAHAEGRRHQPAARNQRPAQPADVLGQIVADYTADHRLTINKQEVPIAEAQDEVPRGLRDPQGQDAVRHRRAAPSRTARSWRSSTRPWAPVSTRSASSPTACARKR